MAIGRAGTSKQSDGGRARAEKLSPDRRSEIALQGSVARWANCSINKLELGRGATRKAGEDIILPRRMVQNLGAPVNALRWHMVEGEAMRPKFDHGDLVILALRESPKDGAVHVVAANDGVVLRRVRAHAGAGWIASCDNPDVREHDAGANHAIVGVVLLRLGRP